MASAQDTAETQVATKPVEAFVGYEARNLYQLYLEWVKQGRPMRGEGPSEKVPSISCTTAVAS